MKEVIEVFKKLRKSPRGRALIFFAVSFLFFLFIAIYARVVGPRSIDKVYNSVSMETTLFGELKNYTYEVTVNVDGRVAIINGKVNEEIEMFTFNNINYYVIEDRCYYLKDGQMIITSNPNPYYRLTNTNIIKKIIGASYLDSTTTYHDKSVVYNYLMDTNKLNDIINRRKTDIASNMNKLVIKVNEKELVDSISYELNEYCLTNMMCKNNMSILLKFSNIGSTEQININN